MKICPQCQTEYADDVEFCSHDGMKLRMDRGEVEDPMVGQVLDGRWVIEDKIGEGGMGSVYRGSQKSVNRTVAIKTLRPALVSNTEFVDRFFREAKIATTINHPHCVTILDFGQTDDEVLYLAMEFLEGLPLADRLEQGQIALNQALKIGEQIAAALEAAHAQNIIHRDLKPDNVFLQSTAGVDVHIKLLDFGIAKDTGSQTQYTRTGQIFGTPNYMSPEQCSGEPLDGRADLYSLGCILYEMFCGKPPFDAASSMAILMAHVTEQPKPPSQLAPVPPQVEALIMKLLAKQREDRFINATAVRQHIAQLRAELEGQAAIARSQQMQAMTSPQAAPALGLADTMAGDALHTPSAPHAPVHVPTPTGMTPEPFAPTAPPKKSKLPLIIGALALMMLVAGGAAALILTGSSEDTTAPAAATADTSLTATDEATAGAATAPRDTTADATPPATDKEPTAPDKPEDSLAANTPPPEEETDEEDKATGSEATDDTTTDDTKVAANAEPEPAKKKRSRKKRRTKKINSAAIPPKQITIPTTNDKPIKTTKTTATLPKLDKVVDKPVKKKKKTKPNKADKMVDGLFGP